MPIVMLDGYDFAIQSTIPETWVPLNSGIWSISASRLRAADVQNWLGSPMVVENLGAEHLYQRYEYILNWGDAQASGALHGVAARFRYDTGEVGQNSFYLIGCRRTTSTNVHIEYYRVINGSTSALQSSRNVTVAENARFIFRVIFEGAAPTSITTEIVDPVLDEIINTQTITNSEEGLQEAGYFAMNRWHASGGASGDAVFEEAYFYGEGAEQEHQTIMAVGDSITRGTQDNEKTYRWWLYNHLVSTGAQFDFVGPTNTPHGANNEYFEHGLWDHQHAGVNGEQTTGCSARIGGQVTTYDPDIILLYSGINDLISTSKTTEQLTTDYEEIIDNARTAKPTIKIICATVSRTSHSGTTNTEVDDFRDSLIALASTKTTVDSPIVIADVWRGYVSAAHNRDGLHPNEDGEQRIAMRFMDTLREHFGVGDYWHTPEQPTLTVDGFTLQWTGDPARTDVYDVERNTVIETEVEATSYEATQIGTYRVRGRRVV